MRTRLLVTLFALALGLLALGGARPVQAQGCQYVLGFAAIYNQIPDVVGPCRSNEVYDTNGNSNQYTANGMMQWRKADNFTAFTDGYRSWVNGPCGLEMRLNTQRFPWEANPEGLAVVASRCRAATGAPAAPPPAAPAPPAPPTTTVDQDTVTTVEEDVKVVSLRRLPAPPAQLTGDVSKRVDEATVQLVRLTDDSIGIATGTVVGDGRTILTSFHVVGDLETGKVYDPLVIAVGPFMGYRLRATVVAADATHDLAVLRVREMAGFGGFTSLPLADSDAVQLGEGAYVYSYPARGEGGLGRSTGSVLGIGSQVKDGRRISFVTEALASPGSSGGVVVNNRGEVMGIISGGVRLSRGIDRRNLPTITQLTVYVPSNWAKALLGQ